jgi:nucleotide-binding universal stress UspA family protein
MIGKRILAPLNLEQSSFDTLEFVAGLAGEMHLCATLLYVVNLNISLLERRVCDDLCRENEQRLKSLAKLSFEGEIPNVCVRVGKPHEEIIAEAELGEAELIVMASPKSRRSKWRLRLTTVEHVVRNAPCLTLVLPRSWKITPQQYRQAMRPETSFAQRQYGIRYGIH